MKVEGKTAFSVLITAFSLLGMVGLGFHPLIAVVIAGLFLLTLILIKDIV